MRIIVACAQYPPIRTGFAGLAKNFVREFNQAGHSTIVLTEGSGCDRIGRAFRLSAEGRRVMRDSGADVVQVIGPSPLFTEQMVSAAHDSGLPVVYKVDAFAGLGTFYGGPVPRLIDGVYMKTLLARALRQADWLVFSTDEFAKNYRASGARTSIITVGLRDQCLGQAGTPTFPAAPPSDGVLRLLFVGQLRRYKGVANLLLAARILTSRGKRVRVTIVGTGPDLGSLEALTDSLGLRGVVHFRGPVDDQGLHAEYWSNDVLLLPSLLGESFGLVLVEAAVHGMKVVASDLPGVREVTNSLGGTVVPPGDPTALADALFALFPLAPSDHRFVPAIAARHSWLDAGRQYLDIYRTILGTGIA